MTLTEVMALRDAQWAACRDDIERAALRYQYRQAGWVLCVHLRCAPHNCTR